MGLVNLEEIFEVNYGSDLELNKLKQVKDGIRFVSRTRKNNGVSAIVKCCKVTPNPKNTISVALGSSSVLFAFLQEKPYYSGRDVAYLKPKIKMTRNELLYYCLCIRANRFRYNFGRQANKTIGTLKIPEKKDIPEYVNKTEIKDLSHLNERFLNEDIEMYNVKYRKFRFADIFSFEQEIRHSESVYVNLVSASTDNNGIKNRIKTNTYIDGNKITISSNGIYTGTAFFQERPFVTQDCIAVGVKKCELNKYIAMYLIAIINYEKFRFNYGRKSGKARLEQLVIRLPVDDNGNPFWGIMERYIKSLNFTKEL